MQMQHGLAAYKLFLHLRLDAAATAHLKFEASAEGSAVASSALTSSAVASSAVASSAVASSAVATCVAAACAAVVVRASATPKPAIAIEAAKASANAKAIGSLLGEMKSTFANPLTGMRVVIDGRHGVVWKVTKTKVAVAFDDLGWASVLRDDFTRLAREETTFDAETAVANALFEPVGLGAGGKPQVLPSACLFNVTVGTADWQLFMKYVPMNGDDVAPPPLDFVLTHGDHVNLLGSSLIAVKTSVRGPAFTPFTFAGLVLGKVENGRLRFALLRF